MPELDLAATESLQQLTKLLYDLGYAEGARDALLNTAQGQLPKTIQHYREKVEKLRDSVFEINRTLLDRGIKCLR
jgi:hypothetical protein